MDITNLTVHELEEKIANGDVSREEVNRQYAENIEKYNKILNAAISVNSDDTIEIAKTLDKEKTSNKYAGIPIGIKDNICIKGSKTTCSSKILENFVAPYDATVIERLKDEKILPICKLNMDEFAMGSSTETSHFGITRNPWKLDRVPGGSSGGSAVAVASNMVPWALGSDTGGSIRQPASFCGVVGLKPTYGRVSRNGLVAFASSLDQIGPITKDVEDAAILMGLIEGYDEKDTTSSKTPVKNYLENLKESIKGKRIAIPYEFKGDGTDEEVSKAIDNVKTILEKQGAIVEEVSLDIAKYSLATYYIIACAEASSNLARFDGVRYTHRAQQYTDVNDMIKKSRTEGFGDEVKRRIILGTYVLSSGYYDAYYKKAQKVRTYVINEFNKVFENYDLILTPTSPTTAFEIGKKSLSPLEMYLADICTVSVNIAGLPGINIPVGVDKNGLPIGIQLIGNKFEEDKVLNCAYNIEKEVQFREKYKPEFKN